MNSKTAWQSFLARPPPAWLAQRVSGNKLGTVLGVDKRYSIAGKTEQNSCRKSRGVFYPVGSCGAPWWVLPREYDETGMLISIK
jgi:hypothetical protein